MRALLVLPVFVVAVFVVALSLPAPLASAQAQGGDPAPIDGGTALDAPGSDEADDSGDAARDGAGEGSSALGSSAEAEGEAYALPRAALLDHRFGEARDGRGERLHAWASLGVFGGTIRPGLTSLATQLDSADAFAIAPSAGARFAMTRELDVSLEWNVVYGSTTVRGVFDGDEAPEPFAAPRDAIESGNPVMQVAFTHDWSVLSLQVGLGAAFPVAALAQAASDVRTAADRAASLVVFELMTAMHGAVDPWRFFPERLSFVLPVRIAVGDRLGGAVEVAGAWTIPVLGSGRGAQNEAALQVAGDVAYEILPELRIGVRGSIVAWRLGRPDGPSRAQGALEPWIRATFGAGFATLRATLDLGGEYGLGTPNGVWAIHLGAGAALDAPTD